MSSHRLRSALAIVAVLLATAGGAVLALETYTQERSLSVGRVDLNVDVGHPGALDLYVPLVDWGVRFDAVCLPVRVKMDVRALDRQHAERVALLQLPRHLARRLGRPLRQLGRHLRPQRGEVQRVLLQVGARAQREGARPQRWLA